jgi:hypothetical protein
MLHGKVDANQPEIVDTFRAVGATVAIISDRGDGFPDLIVGLLGETELVELKSPEGKLTPDQKTWHGTWRGRPVRIVRTIVEALALAAEMRKRSVTPGLSRDLTEMQ